MLSTKETTVRQFKRAILIVVNQLSTSMTEIHKKLTINNRHWVRKQAYIVSKGTVAISNMAISNNERLHCLTNIRA